MTDTTPAQPPPQAEPSRGASALSLLAAPAALGVVVVVNHFVAPALCALNLGSGGFSLLRALTFGVSVLGLLVAVWAGYAAFRYNQRARAAGASSDDSSRFLGVGGFMLAVLFSALTIIVGLSGLALRPCEPT